MGGTTACCGMGSTPICSAHMLYQVFAQSGSDQKGFYSFHFALQQSPLPHTSSHGGLCVRGKAKRVRRNLSAAGENWLQSTQARRGAACPCQAAAVYKRRTRAAPVLAPCPVPSVPRAGRSDRGARHAARQVGAHAAGSRGCAHAHRRPPPQVWGKFCKTKMRPGPLFGDPAGAQLLCAYISAQSRSTADQGLGWT